MNVTLSSASAVITASPIPASVIRIHW
jgi:hypothetical protein